MRKRILDAWHVLRGDMKAVPKNATVFYCTSSLPYVTTGGVTTTGSFYHWTG